MTRTGMCVLGAVVPMLLFCGCVATTRQTSEIKDELSLIRKELAEIKERQDDSMLKTSELNSNILLLSGRLDEDRRHMSRLDQKLDNIITRPADQDKGSSGKISPGEVYRLAYEDFSQGKYNLAILGFREYLDKYPKGDLAGASQYGIAESYFSQGSWLKAKEGFERLIEGYQEEELVKSAHMKLALCLIELNDPAGADAVFGKIISLYPGSKEAQLATQKREELAR